LEEQHTAGMIRKFEELKAANGLKETNEELVAKCTGLEQQLSDKKLEEKVAALSKQVLSEETSKDNAKKVKYFTGLQC